MIAWRKPITLLTATLAAAALPTLLVGGIVFAVAHEEVANAEWWIMFATLFAFAVAHVVLLGFPAAVLLRRRGWVGAAPVALAGVIVGTVPYALYSFPFDATLRVEPWVLDWLQELAVFGVLGVVGAMAFLGVYRTMHRPAVNA